jgi:hypothetical protein
MISATVPDGSRTSWPAPILGLEVVVFHLVLNHGFKNEKK